MSTACGQRAAGHDEEFEHVVEGRRVAAALADDRQDLLQVVAEKIRLAHRLARVHPVDVAAKRVDLAVVRDVAVRMRERPRRKRVRAESLVHERERRFDGRIRQIGKHRLDLIGDQHALVDERVRREARDVEVFPVGARDRQRVDRVLDALADDIELAFEPRGFRPPVPVPVLVRLGSGTWNRNRNLERRRCAAPTNTCLKYGATAAAEAPTRRSSVGRSRQPSSVCPSSWMISSMSASIVARAAGLARQEHAARAVFARRRQRDAEIAGLFAQEFVRHLNEDAGAVACVHLAAARAAMQQVDQQLQRLLDDRRANAHL